MATRKFFDSAAAYDACQTDDSIVDGDTLICHEDKVVGLAHCWPVAITVACGAFHGAVVDVDHWMAYTEITVEQVRVAVAAAIKRGWRVDSRFYM